MGTDHAVAPHFREAFTLTRRRRPSGAVPVLLWALLRVATLLLADRFGADGLCAADDYRPPCPPMSCPWSPLPDALYARVLLGRLEARLLSECFVFPAGFHRKTGGAGARGIYGLGNIVPIGFRISRPCLAVAVGLAEHFSSMAGPAGHLSGELHSFYSHTIPKWPFVLFQFWGAMLQLLSRERLSWGAFPFLLPDVRWIVCIFDLLARGCSKTSSGSKPRTPGFGTAGFVVSATRASPARRLDIRINRRSARVLQAFSVGSFPWPLLAWPSILPFTVAPLYARS